MKRKLGRDDPRGTEDISEELAFHLEGRVRELMDEGLSEPEARREALRRFGDPAAVAAECARFDAQRDRRRRLRGGVDALVSDARIAVRGLRRDAGVSLAVLTTLAVTMGAVTALFSIVDGLLLRPLPYPDDQSLVYLWQNDRATGTEREAAGTADFYDFRDRASTLDALSMFASGSGTLRSEEATRFISAARVHHDLDEVLGVAPVIGRGIRAEETAVGGPSVALISSSLWHSEFGADPAVLGREVRVDEAPARIIGVFADDAATVMGGADLWLPLQVDRGSASRSPHFVTLVGRLAPGASVASAAAEARQIAADLETEVPENVNRGTRVETVGRFLRGEISMVLWLLFGATAVLLLIGASNIASLLTARAAQRDRATAVHTALGAGPGRTIRRHLVEAMILVGSGTVLALGLAHGLIAGLEGVAPARLLALGDVTIDVRVLGFTLLLTGGLATLLALIPTRHALRQDLQRSLHHATAGGQGAMHLRGTLVSIQAGLATVLLIGSILLGATLRNLLAVDPGFRSDDLLRVSMVLPDGRYPRDFSDFPDWPDILDVQQRLIAALEDIPGVESLALVLNHPLDPGFTNSMSVEGREFDPSQGEIATRMVTPSYFETAGVGVVRGRSLREGVGPGDPGEVLLNEAAARVLFPDGPAIGGRIAFWGLGFREIVGVVEDERIAGLRSAAPPALYTSLLQTPPAADPLIVMVRTNGDPLALAEPVRAAIRSVDSGVAVFDASTMAATVATAVARERFAGVLFGAFSGIALFLAAIGVHGMLAFSVARRRREIGVRLALGADRTRVRRAVVARALRTAGAGVVGGLVLAAILAQGVDGLLFGISPTSPLVYLAAGLTLLLVAAIGALVPARRASTVDPATSLRTE